MGSGRHIRFGVAATLVISAFAAVAGEGAPPTRYSGYYEWHGGGRGRLDVTFAPDGRGGWQVKFRFEQARRFQTWRGTALGELGDGPLEGQVRGGRYRFHGEFEDGVFRGRHYEARRSGLKENGTLTFEAIEKRRKNS